MVVRNKRMTSDTMACFGRSVSRFNASHHPTLKGEAIDLKSMSRDYLHEGAYKLAIELRTIEKQLHEPNKSYVLG